MMRGMARKRIALDQFSVETERDDGGVSLVHSYRRCDWSAWADGMTPADIARAARAHARTCGGNPQPRPEQPAFVPSSLMPSIWGEEIKTALARSMVSMAAIPGV
jgi:hypothetical protein